MIRLAVYGTEGRMGRRICALAEEDDRFDLVAKLDQIDSRATGDERAAAKKRSCDAVIDFSTDSGASEAVRHATDHGAALLVGTTGLSPQTLQNMGLAARSIPVMIAPNTSLGVALCNHLIAEIARRIGADFDIDIIEKHHAAKRDAPSGTALRFAQTLRTQAGIDLPDHRVHSLRSGDLVGEHTIEFTGRGEQIKIVHSVTNRKVFALGALNAAVWLTTCEPGQYTMEQFLDLPS